MWSRLQRGQRGTRLAGGVQRGSCNKSLGGKLTDSYGFAPLSPHNRSWLDTEGPEPVVPVESRYSYKLTQGCCDNRASSVSHPIGRTKDGKTRHLTLVRTLNVKDGGSGTSNVAMNAEGNREGTGSSPEADSITALKRALAGP